MKASKSHLVSAPSHLNSTRGRDVRIQMMNVHRNTKVGDIIGEYRQLQRNSTFTDCTLVVKNGVKRDIHSLVLLANSEFLRRWMENSVNILGHKIILPDFGEQELDVLISLLYGLDVLVPNELVSAVNDLIDVLGISVDVPFRTDSGSESQPSDMPLCCWHCNFTFSELNGLQAHLATHGQSGFQKKQHKCSFCKKSFPSMWRLRQHLSQHGQEVKTQASKSSTASKSGLAPLASSSSDHLYASSQDSVREADPPVRMPQTDHLYSAKELTKQEVADLAAKKEQQIQMKKMDHLYSAPSSPSSTPAAHSVTTPKKTFRPKRKHTIQALGHSYAAARPRKVSGSPSTLSGRRKKLSIKMFPCDQCDKEFPQPYRLNRHIREVHIKEKRHFCCRCNKSFFKLTSKDRHELTHTQHDLWKCELCSKIFRDQSSLSYHSANSVCLKTKEKKV